MATDNPFKKFYYEEKLKSEAITTGVPAVMRRFLLVGFDFFR